MLHLRSIRVHFQKVMFTHRGLDARLGSAFSFAKRSNVVDP